MIESYEISGDRIHFVCDYFYKDAMKRVIHNVRFVNGYWSCPLTAHNLITIMSDHDGIDPHKGILSTGKIDSPMRSNPLPLWKHQQDMLNQIVFKQTTIIAAEMRTGKTRGTLEACREWIALHGLDPVELWWISPKSAKMGIRFELDNLYPNGVQEISVLPMTYEEFQKVYHPKLLPRIVIFDEVHKLKSTKTNIGKLSSKIWLELNNKFDDKFLLVGLSGTPSPKDPTDWFQILRVIAPAYYPLAYKEDMLKELAVINDLEINQAFKIPQVVSWKEEAVEEFKQMYLSSIVLAIRLKDVMTLPPKYNEIIKLPVSQKVKKALAFLKRSATSKAILLKRIAQISDGFLYTEVANETETDLDRVTKYVGSPKEAQLRKDLAEYDGNRVCVFAGYRASVDIVVNILREEGWEVLRIDGRGVKAIGKLDSFTRDNKVLLKEFNGATKQMRMKLAVVGHPKSLATGLELSACNLMIYYSHTDDGASEFQSIARAYSCNLKGALTIKHYVHCPVDELIIDRLAKKQELQSTTMGELLKYMEDDDV